ncbi:hypothetical protein LTR94_031037, partial [Friedmanniomyces endolithicus]
MQTLQGPITAAAPHLSQVAAVAAFATGAPHELLRDYRARRDLVVRRFADAPWIPTEALEVTAGVRALIEKRRSGYENVQPNSRILAGLGIFSSLLGTANTAGRRFTASQSYS